MKDDLIALLEAFRLVRAEIDAPVRFADTPDTLERIEEIVTQPHVEAALHRLDPEMDSPGLVPDASMHRAPGSTFRERSH